MSTLLRLYHRLPYPLRVVSASARGYYLRNWRFSDETDEIVESALAREQWSNDQWTLWQQEELARLLHHAATQVPYYREYWTKRSRQGDRSTWESLENWPVLGKEDVRENPQRFVADDCDIRKMFHDHTSGTTGKPLSIWLRRETMRKWYGLNEARVKLWNGVSRHDRWAILGAQMVAPFSRTKPPFWVWNAGLNQLYLSCYHLSQAYAADYLHAMQRYGVRYLLGYPSLLYTLAFYAKENHLEVPHLCVVVCNAEMLHPYQRQVISSVFQCPVVDTYGMVEVVAAASECGTGVMHQWPEVGIIEVLREDVDEPAAIGESGRLICTGLLNRDMPLIRYEAGDRGSLKDTGGLCSCHRTLPVLEHIEGRMDEVVITPDGRRVWSLPAIFRGDLYIREAQIIQEDISHIRLLVVPAPGFNMHMERILIKGLQERLGDMVISLERVEQIPRSANEKFRIVISKVSQQLRE